MAIDISSIIQNHLTEESAAFAGEEEVAEVVEESTSGGVDFGAAVDSMTSGSAYSSSVNEDHEMFMSTTEVEAVRGAIVSGIIAASV